MPDRQDGDDRTREDSIRAAANDDELVQVRHDLAKFTAKAFEEAGTLLHVGGHVIGSDRVNNESAFGHGNDETVAVSLLLRIASELVSASADLFYDGRQYAAAALLRQLVEVEYLAWAFENKNEEGKKWLRSTKEERYSFFTPAKLRKASADRFRSKDYGYHCELGGHPVPGSSALLKNDKSIGQLLLSDLLGHTGHIWDHVIGWVNTQPYGKSLYELNKEMAVRYANWKEVDALVDLPPPP